MDQEGLSAINQSYLGDVAYEKIANAITTGTFRPGEKLTIRNLADALEISSTPVRDAVKRLLLEGALEQRAPRDIRVPLITRERYQEIADIRLELEGLAAARAARRRSSAELESLRSNIRQNEEAIREQDWHMAVRLNKQFHFNLAEMARMPVLQGLLNGLWLQIGPPISSYYSVGGWDMVRHHHDVCEAISRQRPEAARHHIVQDISTAVDSIIMHVEKSTSTGKTGPQTQNQ